MKIRKLINWSIGLVVIAMSTYSVAVHAASVSAMKLVKVGNDRFWQVTADCDDSRKMYKLRRREGTKEWCSIDVRGLCDTNKLTVARMVCEGDGDEPAEPVSKDETNTTPATSAPVAVTPKKTTVETTKASTTLQFDREKLLEEQMELEEQRIKIQQKRLELQRRELELKKRQVGV